jgi:outer membrane biogenesis lipoprotein LolB
MNKLISVFIAMLLLGCAATVEIPQYQTEQKKEQRAIKVRHYDQSGRYTGYSVVGPYNTRHYDKNGRYIGKTVE